MVSRAYYPPPPPHPHEGARYLPSRSCAPYYSYPERRYQLPSHDARSMTMTDPQTDETTPPRKRIAVACGRCRKRKIRCSGDPGGGLPCVNCKNAGVDACLFLRVQSQEAPMREDSRYDYNIDVSRTLAQRSAGPVTQISSSMAHYPQDMHILSSAAIPSSYRSASYTNMGTKGYYPLGADWGDAYSADSAVGDYSLGVPQYQVIGSDASNIVPSYGHWSARQKSIGQNGSVYVDTESAYPYGNGTSTGLVHRPASSLPPDTSAYSLVGIAASLPSAGNERHLPNPAAISRAMGSSSAPYRLDGLPTGYGSTKASQNSVPGSQASPTSPIPDVTAAAAAVGYASSYDYASVGRSSQQHGSSSSDAYGSVSTGSSETIFGEQDRSAASQGSAVDLTGYTYGAASPADASSLRRASSGSGLTTRSAAESSVSTGYAASDGTSAIGSGNFHGSSSSHVHHHRQHHGQSHHASTRHTSHHHTHPHQLPAHAVTGNTAYGEVSGGGSNHSNGVSGSVGGTTVTDSHRSTIVSRR
ncbi:hypothetical protein KVR01_001639 [Diaporthe batatas]|uniref:uncharacterized protein n=1 Tax=Diaporthe batatas TaxID=748121 RepID=UPI001D051B66|nr:uncharacterized protein KVR01_001639 [Diaporthe batatas]KAG8168890.1 hypothetical protein KVR01_001639 [Diaporthe batatas]